MNHATRRTLALSLATLALLFVGLPSARADGIGGFETATEDCPPGFFSGTGEAPCEAAPPGFFVSEPAATSAEPCQPGSFSAIEASVACEPAAPGFFVSEPAATSAEPCQPGSFADKVGSTECTDATAGFFVPGTAAVEQDPCAPGFFQPLPGATSCLQALPGSFAAGPAATTQTPCQPGEFQPAAGATICFLAAQGFFVPTSFAVAQQPCTPGTFAPDAGAAECRASSPGFFVAAEASTEQTECTAGRFQPNERSVSCLNAEPGNFVPVAAASEQTPCPVGRYQPGDGATSCLAASPGHVVSSAGATEQTPCTPGFFQPDVEQTECLAAPIDTFVDGFAAVDPTVCPPGTFQPQTGQTFCIEVVTTPTIVIIAGSDVPPAGDVPIVALLEDAGFSVVIVDDDEADLPAVIDGIGPAAVFVSSTVVPSKVGASLAGLDVAVVVSEAYLFDDFGITAGGFFQGETPPRNQLDIVEPAHPIAAGLTGRQFVTTVNRPLSFGWTPNGTIVARDGVTGRPVIVAFNDGDDMAGFTAPARRVALFTVWNSGLSLTPAGEELIVNAVLWAAAGTHGGGGSPINEPPTVDAGPGQVITLPETSTTVSATLVDDGLAGPVTIMWSGPAGVVFADDSRLITDVTFPGAGVYELVVTVDDSEFVDSASVWVTVREATLRIGVVSGGAAGTPGDRTIVARIEAAGAEAVFIDDDDAASFDQSTVDALFISTSVSISKIGDVFKDTGLPVAVWEGYLFDDMGMAIRSRESPARTQIVMTATSTDPLTAGLSGTQTVYTGAHPLSVAILGGDAESIAHEPSFPQRSALFRIPDGALLADGGTAAGHRIGFFPNYSGAQNLTGVGQTIVDAVIGEILTIAANSGA